MSQEKVNKHKEEKTNRKKILKKQKLKKIFTRIALTVVLLLLATYLGWSIYKLF